MESDSFSNDWLRYYTQKNLKSGVCEILFLILYPFFSNNATNVYKPIHFL